MAFDATDPNISDVISDDVNDDDEAKAADPPFTEVVREQKSWRAIAAHTHEVNFTIRRTVSIIDVTSY
jgi:hypothetical protein